MNYLNYLDLFSGLGGFHQGLQQAGFRFDYVGYSEIDKYAKAVYRRHYPDGEDLGAIESIDTNVLCGK